jgi:hypothetical protein
MAARCSGVKPQPFSPMAVAAIGTKGVSLPNRMCEIGASRVKAAIVIGFAAMAVS